MEGSDSSFNLLHRVAQSELIHLLLEVAPGPKDIVIEDCLMKPLDRIAGASLLKKHDTEKIYRLEGGKPLPWSETAQHRLYLVKPTVANAKFISEHVLSEKQKTSDGHSRQIAVVFVPRKFVTCDRVFEQHGVFGDITVHEFNPSFIPLDSDLLSLELPEFFPSFFLDGSYQWIHSVGRSLWHLQYLYGTIPRVYGIGTAAEKVSDMVETLFWELGEPKPSADQPFSHLFLLDRNIDFVTVLLSCLTYEALLDDCFGIKCGFVDFGPEITKTDKGAKLLLSNQDEIYSSIRDRHFSHVFGFLSGKVKQLQVNYDKRHNLDKVAEMREFVANELKGLKAQHKSLQLHIGAAEVIMGRKSKEKFEDQLKSEQNMICNFGLKETINYMEDWMIQQLPEFQVLSLMSLMSLTQNGLGNKDFLSLRNHFIHAYGHKALYTLHNLKKLGILFEKDGGGRGGIGSVAKNLNAANVATQLQQLQQGGGLGNVSQSSSSSSLAGASSKLPSFQTLCKKLNLIPKTDDINMRDPSDMSYLFNGVYTPALCKLVEQSLQFGFNKEDISRTFACPIVSKDSPLFPGGSGKPAEPRVKRSILVYFLGGVTVAELAGLRLLSRLKGQRIVVATTHVINKQEFIKLIAEC